MCLLVGLLLALSHVFVIGQEEEAVALPNRADVRPMLEAMSSGELDALKPHLHSKYFDQIPEEDKALAISTMVPDMKLIGLELLAGKIRMVAIGKQDRDILEQLRKEGSRVYPTPVAKIGPVTDDDDDYDLGLLLARENEKWIFCLPTFEGIAKELATAMAVRAQGDLEVLQSAITIYESRNLMVPTTAQGLKALVEKPTIAPIPRSWSQMMGKEPLDPWSNPYAYRSPGIKNPNSYDLFSLGADGKESDDDIHAETPKSQDLESNERRRVILSPDRQ